jgi:anti-anti-sigma factor
MPVLRLAGQIRFVTVGGLRRFVDEVVAREDADGVTIDLRDVAVIDSTGLGLLARIGSASLRRCARRAVIVCPDNDVAICLRSAAFDELFVMLDEYPYEDDAPLAEVSLEPRESGAAEPHLGRVILDAHRDLACISERNREVYRDVIAALEAELRAADQRSP